MNYSQEWAKRKYRQLQAKHNLYIGTHSPETSKMLAAAYTRDLEAYIDRLIERLPCMSAMSNSVESPVSPSGTGTKDITTVRTTGG